MVHCSAYKLTLYRKFISQKTKMTQLADLIEKAKNGKRTKDIFTRLSSHSLLDETKGNIDVLEEQIAILDAIVFSESGLDKASSKEIIYALEEIAQGL